MTSAVIVGAIGGAQDRRPSLTRRRPAMQRRSFLAAAGSAAGALALTDTGAAGATRAATTTCPTPIATDTSAADGAAFIAARRMIDLPMGRIACVDVGRGRATLFLHGYPLNGFQWRGAVARLRGERRCIVPDMMGNSADFPSPQVNIAFLSELIVLS